MVKGYVYLLLEVDEKGTEKYKIGESKNDPELRLRNLKTGNPNDLSVLKKYYSYNYKKIERWLHKKYASQKTLSKKEFFFLEDDQVISFMEDCKKIDELVSMLLELNPFYN
jgi:hypothetical protein